MTIFTPISRLLQPLRAAPGARPPATQDEQVRKVLAKLCQRVDWLEYEFGHLRTRVLDLEEAPALVDDEDEPPAFEPGGNVVPLFPDACSR